MLKYSDYLNILNETNLTEEKADANLELNEYGKTLGPFEYYYSPDMDNNNYFVFKRIPFNEYRNDSRVTKLIKTVFLDTDTEGKKKLLDTNFDEDSHYFYRIVSTPRRFGDDVKTDEIKGVTVRYDKDPNRFVDQLTQDGRHHYIVIEKDETVYSVRMNSDKRAFAGSGAEKTVAKRFGWEMENSKIKKHIITRDIGVVPEEYRRATLKDIMNMSDEHMEEYGDLFDIENPNESIDKYDLIIPEGEYAGKKIEVKKYGASKLFEIRNNHKPRHMMLAEQLKTCTKDGLRRLVKWYRDSTNTNVDELLNLNDHLLSYEFRTGNDDELVENIRQYHNARMEYMAAKFDRIPENVIMRSIYGIYFFNLKSGVDGFLIKSEEGGVRNIKYKWMMSLKQWGLKRIKLVFMINPDSYRYVWIGPNQEFAKTFKVRRTDIKLFKDKEYNRTIKTSLGLIKWDHNNGYWDIIHPPDEITGGVGMAFLDPEKLEIEE